MLNFIKNISPTELIIIVVILVVIFGAKLATGLAKTSGQTVKEIKNIKKNFKEALEDEEPEKK